MYYLRLGKGTTDIRDFARYVFHVADEKVDIAVLFGTTVKHPISVV